MPALIENASDPQKRGDMTKGKCQMCKRTLTDNESILRGFGPECEQKRARYLASLDTTEAELAKLRTSTSDVARRRMVAFNGALAAGSTKDAAQLLASARREHAAEPQPLTPERQAVITLLSKGPALFGYINGHTHKIADLYSLLAAMVRDGQIIKLGNGQYALPKTQPKTDTLDNLRTQHGQAAVDAYLWARANSSAPDSEILAAVVERAYAFARAFDGEAVVRVDENKVWNEVAEAA